ncbi:photosynthetic complex assembly protein PuhC [Rhodoplanes serenus]|jgi:putative photosynthetic complex assembly protein|uniref:photosynthetic complex assembly protein PuhC n=1 Tax=Rhodoplanes serenus TaxID=200615 RepID=UPI00131B323F|nr:photosynthetic complex assembly protein PuhC [Rhodoplanes serenus]MBI5114029.1 hypothetical protein [Rhodovulum sp.]
MSDLAQRPFPRGPLFGAAALLAFVLIAVGVARVTGTTPAATPSGVASETVVAARDLRFVDRADGAVVVQAGEDDSVVAVLPPGTNGFVRGTLRGFARDRKRQDVGVEPPFRLTQWADGRLSLADATTGRQVELTAFGATNAEVFAKLLQRRDAAR